MNDDYIDMLYYFLHEENFTKDYYVQRTIKPDFYYAENFYCSTCEHNESRLYMV